MAISYVIIYNICISTNSYTNYSYLLYGLADELVGSRLFFYFANTM